MKFSYIIKVIALLYVVLSSSCRDHDNQYKTHPFSEGRVLVLNSRACYFDDVDSIEKKMKIKIDTPSKKEMEEIGTIMDYVGLPQNFTVYRGDIDNAMATNINNHRIIIYNKDLFTRIDDMDSSYWSSMFIIAHEIGHHLAYNISDTSNSVNAELEADSFAGSVLFKMGADSNQVISAVNSRFISNTKDTDTHPAKYKRIKAVKSGWTSASVLRYQSAVPPEPDEDDFVLNGEDVSDEYEFKLFELMGYPTEEQFKGSYYDIMFKHNGDEMQTGVVLEQIKGRVDEQLQFTEIKKVYIQLYDGKATNAKKSYRMWVELPQGMSHLTAASRSILYRVLRVGRRIKFKTFGDNPHDNWFGYINVVKPEK